MQIMEIADNKQRALLIYAMNRTTMESIPRLLIRSRVKVCTGNTPIQLPNIKRWLLDHYQNVALASTKEWQLRLQILKDRKLMKAT